MLTVEFSRLSIRPGTRLLDLGCGAGRHAFEAARRGAEVVALDTDRGELEQVAAIATAMAEAGEIGDPASITASLGDATRMPFGDDSFDIVIAAEVMEHIPADQAAMNEVARVLRPGGIAAITVPAWLPERICWLLSDDYHNVPGGHIRIFTRHELETKLGRAGLDVGGHHHAHALHSPYWWLKCAVGVHDDDHPLASAYHKLLVWDIMRKPAATTAGRPRTKPDDWQEPGRVRDQAGHGCRQSASGCRGEGACGSLTASARIAGYRPCRGS